MPKVYRVNNKLAIYLPNEVVSELGIIDGEEVDFLKYKDKYFIFAKKSDIADSILSKREPTQQSAKANEGKQISPAELAILKKLDTLRYSQRTKSRVNDMLDQGEKATLQALLKKRYISLFKKGSDPEPLYGIEKEIYNAFLMRKNVMAQKGKAAPQAFQASRTKFDYAASAQAASATDSEAIELLQKQGFIVLSSETEAANVSAALEDSIHHGLILGTRAFNKKFYVVTRGYITKNTSAILNIIRQKSMNVKDIANEAGLEEDGVRAILYILAENGEATELRKDIFKSAE
ncbi:MAG: AbrB/MazE/SpoVT family DNA-binding domain-containing protein [Candidatus Marsarchaeota archaeon]|nr:AbrB/MazE/SpoVT family DNA-binding domain-containing protein [Candidatus Marsarchaeota archaeon]